MSALRVVDVVIVSPHEEAGGGSNAAAENTRVDMSIVKRRTGKAIFRDL
jgi:hypothetical protein